MAVRRLAASPASGGRQDSRPAARRFFLVVLFCLLAWLPASRARALPPTVAAWYLDECVWDGSAGEVRDSGGHGYDGTAVNGVTTTADGHLCRAADRIPGTYIAIQHMHIAGLNMCCIPIFTCEILIDFNSRLLKIRRIGTHIDTPNTAGKSVHLLPKQQSSHFPKLL